MAAAFPFLFDGTLRNTSSTTAEPKAMMDLSSRESASFRNLAGLMMQTEIFDLNGVMVRASTRTYQGSAREYERIHNCAWWDTTRLAYRGR